MGLSLLLSCQKEEDMVLDRVVSPVLITASSGSFDAAENVVASAVVLELDKSGLLNYQVGIDSLPVANLPMALYAGGAKVAELATDAQGKISVTKTWAELGLAAPKKGNAVNLEWSGQHKGQGFVKQTRVQVK
ncbi:MAG: hypothetical protein H7Z75_11130 [Ferruginibacter sp.]|nr:hypothetical protein [Cytophagales bacterium]